MHQPVKRWANPGGSSLLLTVMGVDTRLLALAILLGSSTSMVLPSMHHPSPHLSAGGMQLRRGPISLLAPMRVRVEETASIALPLPDSPRASPSPPEKTDSHRLVTAIFKWGLAHCSNADDMLLAMASPLAHRFFSEWRRTVIGDLSTCARALDEARQMLLSLLRPGTAVSVRTKGLWSTMHKVALRGKVPNDMLAVRIVVKGGEVECFEALALVHRLWPAAAGRLKDYITRPKANGYQALHETVLLPDGQPMEIQIRSETAHDHAEHGLASHRRYKGPIGQLPQLVLAGLAQ